MQGPPPRRNISSSALADWQEVIARELGAQDGEHAGDGPEDSDPETDPGESSGSDSDERPARKRAGSGAAGRRVRVRAGSVDKGERGCRQKPEGKPPPLACPRCSSADTKFCYYNNYNVKQPRYFCKACQRYWTVGGTLRNIAPGSGRRKSKSAPSRQASKISNTTLVEQLVVTQPAILQASAFPTLNTALLDGSTFLTTGHAPAGAYGIRLPTVGWGGGLGELPGGGLRELQAQLEVTSALSGQGLHAMHGLDARLLMGGGGHEDLPAAMAMAAAQAQAAQQQQQVLHAAQLHAMQAQALQVAANGVSPSPSPNPLSQLARQQALLQQQQQASSPPRQGQQLGSTTSQPQRAANGTASDETDAAEDGGVVQGRLVRFKHDPDALGQDAGGSAQANGGIKPKQEGGPGSSSNSSTGLAEPGMLAGSGGAAKQQQQQQQQQQAAALQLAILHEQQQQQQQLLTHVALQQQVAAAQQQQLLQQLGGMPLELQRTALLQHGLGLGLGGSGVTAWPVSAGTPPPSSFTTGGAPLDLFHAQALLLQPTAQLVHVAPAGGVGGVAAPTQEWVSLAAASAAAGGATKPQAVHPHQAAAAMAALQAAVGGSGGAGGAQLLQVGTAPASAGGWTASSLPHAGSTSLVQAGSGQWALWGPYSNATVSQPASAAFNGISI